MRPLNYQIVVMPEDKGDFPVFVPGFPGCVTISGSLEESLNMTGEVIDFYNIITNDVFCWSMDE
jgi:predicted RNase H-like HicB family nuclease